jgi:hypothetical protein
LEPKCGRWCLIQIDIYYPNGFRWGVVPKINKVYFIPLGDKPQEKTVEGFSRFNIICIFRVPLFWRAKMAARPVPEVATATSKATFNIPAMRVA